MNHNWAGVSIGLGLLTLVCTIFPWPLLIVGVVLTIAYRSRR